MLTRKWRTGAAWIVVGFTVVWDAFLVMWYAFGLTRGDLSWGLLLFPLLHVAFGLVLTYASLGMLFNSTVIEVSADLLRVATGPIPFHREVRVSPSEIREVRYHEHASRGYSSSYDLRAVLNSGEEKNLLRGLGEYSEVLFYTSELRSSLGLSGTTKKSEASAS
ncbi:hypothetical protein [Oleiharenicola lentus]|uniref:hypothetical protein n=1 Tax=Oleiharenicola lentus TaxID=2508720 RepID=UPI003F66A992